MLFQLSHRVIGLILFQLQTISGELEDRLKVFDSDSESEDEDALKKAAEELKVGDHELGVYTRNTNETRAVNDCVVWRGIKGTLGMNQNISTNSGLQLVPSHFRPIRKSNKCYWPIITG